MREPVSSLALGQRGWIQRLNFVGTGLLMLAFADGLRQASPATRASSPWGPRLVAVYAVGLIGPSCCEMPLRPMMPSRRSRRPARAVRPLPPAASRSKPAWPPSMVDPATPSPCTATRSVASATSAGRLTRRLRRSRWRRSSTRPSRRSAPRPILPARSSPGFGRSRSSNVWTRRWRVHHRSLGRLARTQWRERRLRPHKRAHRQTPPHAAQPAYLLRLLGLPRFMLEAELAVPQERRSAASSVGHRVGTARAYHRLPLVRRRLLVRGTIGPS